MRFSTYHWEPLRIGETFAPRAVLAWLAFVWVHVSLAWTDEAPSGTARDCFQSSCRWWMTRREEPSGRTRNRSVGGIGGLIRYEGEFTWRSQVSKNHRSQVGIWIMDFEKSLLAVFCLYWFSTLEILSGTCYSKQLFIWSRLADLRRILFATWSQLANDLQISLLVKSYNMGRGWWTYIVIPSCFRSTLVRQ